MARKKIYAVKKGKTTGIFINWDECRDAVAGYPGAEYKSFFTEEDANAYLYGTEKDERNHFLEKEEECLNGQMVAYVDGSFDEKIGRYAFGCVMIMPDGEIVRESGNGDNPDSVALRNVTGEMLGAMYAVKWCEKNGYSGLEKLYVSCEYRKNKGTGELFRMVRGEFPPETRLIHVGDNEQSDVKMAEKCGFAVLYYPNVNRQSQAFRPYDMSPVVGGAYRGIVNNRLYQGDRICSPEYEYGFIYGGLFVLGYCRFIHEYCHSHGVEKLLFLSRDGDILKEAYDRLYPEADTSYVCWSRNTATKLMAEFDRYDYFRRYLYHKINQGITVGAALEAMELGGLWETHTLQLSDELTDRNADTVKDFILDHYAEVCSVYRDEQRAAQVYYGKVLAGIGHAAAVDIGWAGSGAISLSFLAEKVWGLSCRITGIIAGTNTIHNREPDAGEMFLQNGRLVSYLFSQSHNRDVMKRHDPGKDYNVYWELLLSSPERKFLGFGFGRGEPSGIYAEDGREVCLSFGKQDANQEGIMEIRRGILDFVSDYTWHFEKEPSLLRISGRDACAPMLAAASRNEKYLKAIAARFALEKGI